MPVFESRNTFEFGSKGKSLGFGVKVELTGLGDVLDYLGFCSRAETKPVKSVAPPYDKGRVWVAPTNAKGIATPQRGGEKSLDGRGGAMPLCKVCDLPDWEDEEFQAILDELELSWAKERKHRKAWEFAQGIRGLRHLGSLKPEAVAIGVGAGHEQPLYYLANHIREVHATDIYGSGAFAQGEGAAEMLTNPKKFAPFPYREDHLVVKYMDGRDLEYPDESFDIAFSFSSIEHFGGHRAASQAMREMARVLRPGGVAAITTELILNQVPHEEFFLPEELYEYLVQPSGLELVEDIDFAISLSVLNNPINLRADYEGIYPHIVLNLGPVVFTSVMMFLQKSA